MLCPLVPFVPRRFCIRTFCLRMFFFFLRTVCSSARFVSRCYTTMLQTCTFAGVIFICSSFTLYQFISGTSKLKLNKIHCYASNVLMPSLLAGVDIPRKILLGSKGKFALCRLKNVAFTVLNTQKVMTNCHNYFLLTYRAYVII
jgi:hypothetical protein